MSKDLSKLSIVELREELARLEAKRAGELKPPLYFADAKTEVLVYFLYRINKENIGESRYLDLQIYDLKQEIISREST